MKKIKERKWLILFGFLTLIIILALNWIYKLDLELTSRLKNKRFAPPLEFYSAPIEIRLGRSFPMNTLLQIFKQESFRERSFEQTINEKDFSIWSTEDCKNIINKDDIKHCVVFAFPEWNIEVHKGSGINLIVYNSTDQIMDLFHKEMGETQFLATPMISLPPRMFAQFYGDKPILRNEVTLGQVPAQCLNSLLAIEDSLFLEHKGISLTGIFRAFYRNFLAGRLTQGGSTITQQMVKNYFLNSKKTLSRKIPEVVMSLLIELKMSKDEILETYLNLIYMGQNGSYEVRGYGSASQHYFNKNIQDLDLSECALLAAIVNSPGLYNPFKYPERTLKRRKLVLERMEKLSLISADIADKASQTPLPQWNKSLSLHPAPYFVDAAKREILKLGISMDNGLKVFTSLWLDHQDNAQTIVKEEIEKLELKIKKKNPPPKKELQALLIAADIKMGLIRAIVGGRNYSMNQFNRALDSHRQVGSIMKPLVYLSALETVDENGQPYTPMTTIMDSPFEHKYQRQIWKPKNYNNQYYGEVPLFFALKNSLNSATAKLGLKIGLEQIIDLSRRLGIYSKIEPVPALTLGAFELFPMEILNSYTTIARWGKSLPLSFILAIQDLDDHEIYRIQNNEKELVSIEPIAQLIGMMKQTLLSGTGQSVLNLGFTLPAAGKTGTTSDTKDAWFVGFTPDYIVLVWVGYDDNQKHGLTGASGALPIWTRYMKSITPYLSGKDFEWPSNLRILKLDLEKQEQLKLIPLNLPTLVELPVMKEEYERLLNEI